MKLELKMKYYYGRFVKCWRTRHKAQLISELPSLLLARIEGGDFPEYLSTCYC